MAARAGLLRDLGHDLGLFVAAITTPLLFGQLRRWTLIAVYVLSIGVALAGAVSAVVYLEDSQTRAERRATAVVDEVLSEREKIQSRAARNTARERELRARFEADRGAGHLRAFASPSTAIAGLAGHIEVPGPVRYETSAPELNDFYVRLPVRLQFTTSAGDLRALLIDLSAACRFCEPRLERATRRGDDRYDIELEVSLYVDTVDGENAIEGWNQAIARGEHRGPDLSALRE